MKYIFVEGKDDDDLISKIIVKMENFKIITYAEKKKQKVNDIIKTLKKMNNEYVLLADLDEKDQKKRIQEIKERYKDIEVKNIYFSIQEIEAWYLSGISDKCINKYKVKNNILQNTENVTKEKFENIFKNRRDTILEIKLKILSEFDIEKAKLRNNSLKIFLENCI